MSALRGIHQVHPSCFSLLGAPPYPLLVQLHQLLGDLGRVESQAQAVHVELRHQVLQHLFERQPPRQAVLRRGGYSVFQDGASQGVELEMVNQRERRKIENARIRRTTNYLMEHLNDLQHND